MCEKGLWRELAQKDSNIYKTNWGSLLEYLNIDDFCQLPSCKHYALVIAFNYIKVPTPIPMPPVKSHSKLSLNI